MRLPAAAVSETTSASAPPPLMLTGPWICVRSLPTVIVPERLPAAVPMLVSVWPAVEATVNVLWPEPSVTFSCRMFV